MQYAFDRSNRLSSLEVDGVPVALDLAAGDALDRIPARVVATLAGTTVYVDGGRFAFDVPPRFVSPDEAGRAGSTVARCPAA